MNIEDLIEVNKLFSDGKILNKSDINHAILIANESKDWQFILTHFVKAIICGHMFFDGNKRTATALILYFFNQNEVLYDNSLLIKSVINIAKMKEPNFIKIQREINKCLK